jgi:hypothetical protein
LLGVKRSLRLDISPGKMVTSLSRGFKLDISCGKMVTSLKRGFRLDISCGKMVASLTRGCSPSGWIVASLPALFGESDPSRMLSGSISGKENGTQAATGVKDIARVARSNGESSPLGRPVLERFFPVPQAELGYKLPLVGAELGQRSEPKSTTCGVSGRDCLDVPFSTAGDFTPTCGFSGRARLGVPFASSAGEFKLTSPSGLRDRGDFTRCIAESWFSSETRVIMHRT